MSDLRAEVTAAVAAMRAASPLVHGATGSVTRAIVADGLLAVGARPMLTETVDEAPTLVTVADAFLANLGSLSSDGRAGLLPTAEVAAERGTPWVLDPTAIGLAPVRTPLALELLALGPSIVRGNASEVLVLAGGGQPGRGADSTVAPDAAAEAAHSLAAAHGCVVAVSGAVDLVTDGRQSVRIASGAPVLTRVTGTGCLLGALSAAHAAVAAPFVAAVAATALLTVASERVGGLGPGSFRVGLLDALDAVTPTEVGSGVRLT
ncbi:hydroxyethylthiazole kinase, sugar kinase family protein [Janibacter hoylei PVAS-1]|uniref:Hydroxyethylthiazole kinase n=1 Tax=Janibacter hoylei PVAS-1 TaxID=1210046 RepID=K1E1T8_9MICO|nr:hydroxyethylthiazole kinase [Janibacter hoylei]EKA62835.1 hydroxyethylthiazole kinase, sugar kinase family protein [Janibacter hoylei PVAS-1]RWU82108.1 hydroxyethylthiazole kinase [Janibacter hoylei PVAS-1]